PAVEQRLSDVNQELAHLETLRAGLTDDEIQETDARFEELRLMVEGLQKQPNIIKKAGLTFDFPLSTRIIIDPNCSQLVDCVVADWLAEEFLLTKDKVKEIYGVDVGSNYTGYAEDSKARLKVTQWGNHKIQAPEPKGDLVCVWEMYDRRT